MLIQGFLCDLIFSTICPEGHIDLYLGGSTASLQEGHSYRFATVMKSIKPYHLLLPFPQPWAVRDDALYRGPFALHPISHWGWPWREDYFIIPVRSRPACTCHKQPWTPFPWPPLQVWEQLAPGVGSSTASGAGSAFLHLAPISGLSATWPTSHTAQLLRSPILSSETAVKLYVLLVSGKGWRSHPQAEIGGRQGDLWI